MNRNNISILGVPFHPLTLEEALAFARRSVNEKRLCFIVTPNPEICLKAYDSPEYLGILRSADMRIADGFGILWAARYLSGKPGLMRFFWTILTPWITRRTSPLPERVTGVDVMKHFCRNNPDRKIFLLGARPEINRLLAEKLRHEWGVNVCGRHSGNPDMENAEKILRRIRKSGAQILFVAFGAPAQEKWIAAALPQLPEIRLAMGVGGAFDFLSGKRKRAPLWIRHIGLEWGFRLLMEPRRILRIYRAVFLFPYLVYRHHK